MNIAEIEVNQVFSIYHGAWQRVDTQEQFVEWMNELKDIKNWAMSE